MNYLVLILGSALLSGQIFFEAYSWFVGLLELFVAGKHGFDPVVNQRELLLLLVLTRLWTLCEYGILVQIP